MLRKKKLDEHLDSSTERRISVDESILYLLEKSQRKAASFAIITKI
jgi:hypothetical protein